MTKVNKQSVPASHEGPTRIEILKMIKDNRISVSEGLELIKQLGPNAQGAHRTVEERETLERDLIRLCTQVLKVKESDVDTEEELRNYGLDSIMMTTLTGLLSEKYGKAVSPHILAERNTIKSLASYLIAEGMTGPGTIHREERKPLSPDDMTRSKNLHSRKGQRIAVVGMVCRFPHSASPEEFWENLEQARNLIDEVPAERWKISDYFSPDRKAENKSYSRWGGYIQDIYSFDAHHFGISAEDALVMDPQQRILLELAEELFCRAGFSRQEVMNQRMGVYIGAGESSYVKSDLSELPGIYMKHWLANTIQNMMAARISDFWDLKGPSQVIDTACSSSLVAVHRACQDIRHGECEMAVAGGIELLIGPHYHIAFSKAGILTDDSVYHVFDEQARGFILGEGAGLVLLKSFDRAVEDGDRILGVILGSAVNNDGHTAAVTVPGLEGQKDVIRRALDISGVCADSISLLEAHGSGSLLGDSIEVEAATQVYRAFSAEKKYCGIGSVKPNIGHLGRAAGIASFIKMILALNHRLIPPLINCRKPHHWFKFEDSPFYPVIKLTEWFPGPTCPVRCGAVSSFGFGGTNCHIIVEEFTDGAFGECKRSSLELPQFQRKYYRLDDGFARSQSIGRSRPSPAAPPLLEKIEIYLSDKLAMHLNVDAQMIRQGKGRNFMDLGLASSQLVTLAQEIEADLGIEFYPPLFFEHQNLEELSRYFLDTHAHTLADHFNPAGTEERTSPLGMVVHTDEPHKGHEAFERDIAIIGMSGRFAHSPGLEEFWENVLAARDLIQEIPPDRWDIDTWFDEDREAVNRTYCKWGSFIEVDKFDPYFFNISPREAIWMDPQQRLLLEVVHSALEDAGWGQRIYGTDTGVFVGASIQEYWEEIVRTQVPIVDYQAQCSQLSYLSGRISYTFDLHGPNMTVDTACSSSLSALYLACRALAHLECDMAFVASANLLLSHLSYVYVSRMQALSPTGRCHAFDKSADGYVPGEGVAAVLLKPLTRAIQDGDHIYAVIKGIAANHVGRASNPFSPRTELQTKLLLSAWKNARIDPGTLSFIEAHGTGTILGDPIEVNALKKAFSQFGCTKKSCALGTVKANIGHLESTAGLAGLIKTVLSMRHKQIPSMPYFKELNPYITLEDSPLYINTQPIPWETRPGQPRRAGVSSFGIAGSGVHAVLEEYIPGQKSEEEHLSDDPSPMKRPLVFTLSARDRERLKAYVGVIIDFLGKSNLAVSLADIVYTMQTGRQAMEERLAAVISSIEELKQKLHRYDQGDEEIEGFYQGSVREDEESQVEGGPMREGDADELAQHWVRGGKIDWSILYNDSQPKPRRIPLPTYPFARERYWKPEPRETITESPDLPTPPSTYYHGVWQQSPTRKGEGVLPSQAVVLLFAAGEEVWQVLMNQPSDAQPGKSRYILVKPGTEFREAAEDLYEIDPENPADYEELFRRLRNHHLLPQRVLHMWNAAPMPELEGEFYLPDLLDGRKGGKNLTQRFLSRGIYAIFYLIRALEAEKVKLSDRLVIFYSGDTRLPNPFLDALSGFSASLEFLFPHLHLSCVEVTGTDIGPADLAEIALQELDIQERSREIRYEGKLRFVKTMQPIQLEPPTASLKKSGVYLVTGGAGELGLLFADRLARHYQARLVLVGRSPLSLEKQETIAELNKKGADVSYMRADVSSLRDMKQVMKAIRSRFKKLDGVFHAAGVFDEKTVLEKDISQFNAVLQPKLWGTMVLDEVTRQEPLDFFVMFSSASAILGDFGQCDYAVANRFMDSYGHWREALHQKKRRRGQTKKINWPLWKAGGLHLGKGGESLYLRFSGMGWLETDKGLEAFEKIIGSHEMQVMVVPGKGPGIERFLAGEREQGGPSPASPRPMKMPVDSDLKTQLETDIMKIAADILNIDAGKLKVNEELANFGFDSLSLKEFSSRLNDTYRTGTTPSIFFSHNSIRSLAENFIADFGESIRLHYTNTGDTGPSRGSEPYAQVDQIKHSMGKAIEPMTGKAFPEREPVAVIGAAAIFPGADDLNRFWLNLETQVDSITEIPPDRWDWREYYSNKDYEKNKTCSRWGGFIDDVDKFDAPFFNISPREAELMDPQHRLFLQTAWKAVEDAGYRVSQLSGLRVGVFVGMQFTDYKKLVEDSGEILGQAAVGNANAMLCNRVSYLFDLKGPSETLDTACSGSLVAIHRAFKSIQIGESELAIAGGVSLMFGPAVFLSAGPMGILSPSGRCRTFDRSADGYVRGEGVGALLLKPLRQAIADNDHIYTVIKGSAVNHGGRANFLTAPNFEAQAAVLASAYEDADIDPGTVTYIEVHGTGTELGDPVEIEGLKTAFDESMKPRGKSPLPTHYCGLGTVKTNIGHLEPAAGIAGVLKVILAMKRGILPGNLHFNELNRYIDLHHTPFYILDRTQPWLRMTDEQGRPIPRRAGVSSFGLGGTNAHMVFEEYEDPKPGYSTIEAGSQVIVLSARNKDRLKQYARDILEFLGKIADEKEANTHRLTLADMAYTLQLGREAMAERLALVISSLGELREYLSAYCQEKKGVSPDQVYEGRVETDNEDEKEFTRQVIEKRDLKKIARFWVSGLNIEWQLLYPTHLPHRISLPTYPFEKRRYWFDNFQDRSEKRSNQPAPVSPESQRTGKVVLRPRQVRSDTRTAASPGILTQTPLTKIPLDTRPIARPEETDIERVLPTVINIVGNVLHVPACELDLELPFRELGVDSINGVEIIRGINKAFHLDLEAVSLYDYSNVTTLAQHISRESGKNKGGEQAKSEPLKDNVDAADIMDTDYRVTRLLTRLQEGELDDDQVRKQLEAIP